jgi:hypothetical protein
MDDDGDVLRFRPRNLFEESRDDPGPYGAHPSGGPYVDDRPHGYTGTSAGYGGGLGDLAKVVLIGDHVVDVVREPVDGSGYECAALELRDRGLLRAARPPAPAPPPPLPPRHEQTLAWLARIVGGDDALAALDEHPLEPVALCLDGIRDDLIERVRAIDVRLQQWAPVVIGDEGLAAARRLLTRAVSSEPGLLTRSDRDDVATGAVLWALAKGNDLVGTNRPVRVGVIQDVCGLSSSPSGRGASFAHAVGGDGSTSYGRPLWMFDAQPAVIPLGSPDLLVRRFRHRLVLMRDLALQLRARTPVP